MARWRGNWRFRPSFAPTVAVLLLLPILISLGIWQLQRAEQKSAVKTEFAAGAETVFVDGSAVSPTLSELPTYQRIELSGHYASDRQFLLDNMTDGGSAGYQVLTPFVPEGSDTWVLVNRGWIPKKFGTTLLPDVEVSESDRRVAGRITRLPRPGLELAGDPQAGPEWPRVTQFPTIEELAEALGADLAQRMVLLEPSAADGFLRKWNPVEFGPERHLGYAFQWFALAATLLIIYVGLNLKRSGNGGR